MMRLELKKKIHPLFISDSNSVALYQVVQDALKEILNHAKKKVLPSDVYDELWNILYDQLKTFCSDSSKKAVYTVAVNTFKADN